jgi:hypothetical protein
LDTRVSAIKGLQEKRRRKVAFGIGKRAVFLSFEVVLLL